MATSVAPAPTAAEPLRGRTALVTGASRGIGAAIARRLDAAGARVALTARDETLLRSVAAGLEREPVIIPADLGEADGPGRVADAALEALDGRVDVLVNNAGAGVFAPSTTLTAGAVDELLALNVRSALLLTALIAPQMAERGFGSIVNLSSAVVERGTPVIALYAASKGAIDASTRALAAEWGPSGVRVNAVRPGIVRTDMTAGLLADPAISAHYDGTTALGRAGEPDDVAEVVAFLSSDAARYVTAQAITVDGGWTHTGSLMPTGA